MRHKWSWGGQDDIQLNLEEKEAIFEDKDQCRAQCLRSWDCFPPVFTFVIISSGCPEPIA